MLLDWLCSSGIPENIQYVMSFVLFHRLTGQRSRTREGWLATTVGVMGGRSVMGREKERDEERIVE